MQALGQNGCTERVWKEVLHEVIAGAAGERIDPHCMLPKPSSCLDVDLLADGVEECKESSSSGDANFYGELEGPGRFKEQILMAAEDHRLEEQRVLQGHQRSPHRFVKLRKSKSADLSLEGRRERSLQKISRQLLIDQRQVVRRVVQLLNSVSWQPGELHSSIEGLRERVEVLPFPRDFKEFFRGVVSSLTVVYSGSERFQGICMDKTRMSDFSDAYTPVWKRHESAYPGLDLGELAFGELGPTQRSALSRILTRYLLDEELLGLEEAEVAGSVDLSVWLEVIHIAEIAQMRGLIHQIEDTFCQWIKEERSYDLVRVLFLALHREGLEEVAGRLTSTCKRLLLTYYIHGGRDPDEEVLSFVRSIHHQEIYAFHSSKLLPLLPFCRALEELKVNYLWQEHLDLLETSAHSLVSITTSRASFQTIPKQLSGRLEYLDCRNNKRLFKVELPAAKAVFLDSCYRLKLFQASACEHLKLSCCYNLEVVSAPKAARVTLQSNVLLETLQVSKEALVTITGCDSLKATTAPLQKREGDGADPFAQNEEGLLAKQELERHQESLQPANDSDQAIDSHLVPSLASYSPHSTISTSSPSFLPVFLAQADVKND